ncbi:hypothetical protein CPC08DRAFT_704221 [Agrocybe pediades]|nr:hypothetical protein CPC08DRAFT_704221 [Agrocybe pediades]
MFPEHLACISTIPEYLLLEATCRPIGALMMTHIRCMFIVHYYLASAGRSSFLLAKEASFWKSAGAIIRSTNSAVPISKSNGSLYKKVITELEDEDWRYITEKVKPIRFLFP